MSKIVASNKLVFLWGWGRYKRGYKKLIETAPSNWEIYQLPYSSLIPSGDVQDLHKNLLQFLDSNNLDKVYLSGHSLGGAFALDFAVHHPKRVKKLFLFNSEGVYDAQPLWKVFMNIVLFSHKSIKDDLRDLVNIFRYPLLYFKLGKMAHNFDLQEEAEDLKVPTVVMWGEKDKITPLWQGERLHELIRGSKLIVHKGVGHDWIVHSPELFWENI